MIKKQYIFSILAIMVLMLVFASCAPARQPNNRDDVQQNVTPGTRQTKVIPENQNPNTPLGTPSPNDNTDMTPKKNTDINDNKISKNNTDNQNNNNNSNMQQRAKKIADAVTNQKEIESATCVLTGNTAMIGVQFNKQYKGKLTGEIKKSVEKKAQDADDRISRVVVTADPDLVSRLEEVLDDIGKGKPFSGFVEELNEMINRIEPK